MEVDHAAFHLRAELRGHGEDVRAVAQAGKLGVATTSRDKTVRLWTVDDASTGGVTEATVFVGHTHFVGPLVWVPPGVLPVGAEEGALVTGSRDTTVIVWHPHAAVPLQRLAGHTQQVSALCVTASGDIVSGDHGGELRVWRDGTCAQVLSCGAPVLSVSPLPTGGFAASTGNPLCAVLFFDRSSSGAWTRTRLAQQLHGDAVRCVRCVDALPGSWATASHDGTARLWVGWDAATPEVEYIGHTALVYSVCASPDGSCMATGSEDNSAKVWDSQTGACAATLPHPACVWDVTWLANGDLVTACGDGVARIWTRDASKRNADLATALDASLAAQVAAQGAQTSAGADGTHAAAGLPPGVKLEPRSALTKPGARDGVTIVVEEDGGCNAYTWDASGRTWECVGQVVAPPAATGGVVSTSSNGADFTFDVDVADGAPPRKLSYSVGQNPYAVADTWLAEQGMPAGYREQIVTFLVQNTGGPTGAAAQALAAAGTVNADPFTGGGSYMPPAVPTAPPTVPHTSPAASQRAALQYVPVRTTVTFESMPAQEALAGKLRTFMAAHGGAFNDAHSASLDAVLAYAASAASSATAQPPACTAPLLAALLTWPADQLFPVFDLMRLLVLTPPGANTCGAPDVLAALPSALQRVGSQSPDAPGAAAGHVTALRLCCNACSHPGPLRQWMTRSVDSLLEWFSASPACASKPVRGAFGSLLLNLALHATQQPVDGDEETKLVLLSAAVAAAASTPADDDDALFRALVALGTLCHTSSGLAATARELGARDVATAAVQRGGGGKAPGAAQDVMTILGR